MALTHNHQLPIPEDGDAPNIPAAMAELAERLENVFTELEERLARLEASIFPEAG